VSLVTSKPVPERIADVIEKRLQKIVAGGSYYVAGFEVVRPTRNGNFTPQDNQFIIVQDEIEIVSDLMCPGNPPAMAYRITYNIFAHSLCSETDITPADYFSNYLMAEIKRAIVDAPAWYHMEGLAIDSMFGSPALISNDGGVDGINVPVQVTFRVTEGDMMEVRG
jgi:hypothetical protein